MSSKIVRESCQNLVVKKSFSLRLSVRLPCQHGNSKNLKMKYRVGQSSGCKSCKKTRSHNIFCNLKL